MKNMVLGQDATFTLDSFIKRYNADLANDYGNVINRVFVLINKYFNSLVPEPGEYSQTDNDFVKNFEGVEGKIFNFIEEMKIHDLAEYIFSLIRSINKYLEQKAPWKTYKEYPNQKETTATTLYLAIESIRLCSQMLNPIMPNKTSIVLDAINAKKISFKFGEIKSGQKINSVSTLFPRIDL